ncbi:MAG: hypothetical protein P1U34_05830 [Coxiellaceae bacterium]|nr:hypothetical protein [Coxiellaceae bacterium]
MRSGKSVVDHLRDPRVYVPGGALLALGLVKALSAATKSVKYGWFATGLIAVVGALAARKAVQGIGTSPGTTPGADATLDSSDASMARAAAALAAWRAKVAERSTDPVEEVARVASPASPAQSPSDSALARSGLLGSRPASPSGDRADDTEVYHTPRACSPG